MCVSWGPEGDGWTWSDRQVCKTKTHNTHIFGFAMNKQQLGLKLNHQILCGFQTDTKSRPHLISKTLNLGHEPLYAVYQAEVILVRKRAPGFSLVFGKSGIHTNSISWPLPANPQVVKTLTEAGLLSSYNADAEQRIVRAPAVHQKMYI